MNGIITPDKIATIGYYGGTALVLLGTVLLVTVIGKAVKARKRRARRDAIREARIRQEREDWVNSQIVKRIARANRYGTLAMDSTSYIPRFEPISGSRLVNADDTNIIPKYSDPSATRVIHFPDRVNANGSR
jgi:hypothetical protein